ncbi:hypothetical protein Nmel_007350, partial [Mimus melanotis]
ILQLLQFLATPVAGRKQKKRLPSEEIQCVCSTVQTNPCSRTVSKERPGPAVLLEGPLQQQQPHFVVKVRRAPLF